MVDINKNEPSEVQRGEGYESFVQLQSLEDPADFLRLKSIQQVPLDFDFTDVDRYNDEGKLFLVKTGQNHTSTINLILTADMVDDVDPPTNKDTISFWLREKFENRRVTLTVRYIYLTRETTDGKIRLQVTLEVVNFGLTRNIGDVIELPVNVRILDSNLPILIRE